MLEDDTSRPYYAIVHCFCVLYTLHTHTYIYTHKTHTHTHIHTPRRDWFKFRFSSCYSAVLLHIKNKIK